MEEPGSGSSLLDAPGGAKPTQPEEAHRTSYVILREVLVEGGEPLWREEGTQGASSRSRALSHFYADGVPDPAVRYQAVPESSWKAMLARPPKPGWSFGEAD